jgi:hypothetical protein
MLRGSVLAPLRID